MTSHRCGGADADLAWCSAWWIVRWIRAEYSPVCMLFESIAFVLELREDNNSSVTNRIKQRGFYGST
jgi:hypothetical protein